MQTWRFLLYFFLFSANVLSASPEEEFPVLYKGRFRPAEAYARLWLHELYHAQSLKDKDLASFHTNSPKALHFLWELHFLGSSSFKDAPLFWVQSAELKRWVGLELKLNRFSDQDLAPLLELNSDSLEKRAVDEVTQLKFALKNFEKIRLEADSNASPLSQRLREAGSLFYALPSRLQNHEWLPLSAMKIYSKNFTAYSDEHFVIIRDSYLAWEQAVFHQKDQKPAKEKFFIALMNAYATIAGKVYQEAEGKALTYPTLNQLKAEVLYYKYPFLKILILLYCLSFLVLFVSMRSTKWSRLAWFGLILTFLLHTLFLVSRSYILGRPPVSNMSETVIYVPWVAVLASLLIYPFQKQHLLLISSSAVSIILLTILEITDLNTGLDQVQAVLDSQFWLMIHVLMIVGSYGVFFLGALLGHFYLGSFIYHKVETPAMKSLSQAILQSMYLGTALLIPGTILGGIWAAESWGRFWDWDPKESWAFISSCFYLIWIHAYRFHRIGSFGLAVGAVSGCLAISFTWYGVNYILGAGLHSYGFGSGGEIYYYTYVLGELLFIGLALLSWRGQRKVLEEK